MGVSHRLFLVCMAVVLTVSWAWAGEVVVMQPLDEELSPMALRGKAMDQGFAQAVLDEAQSMLPGELDEARAAAFKEFMLTRSKPYVQGYKLLSSTMGEEGLSLSLDVRVNKRLLRDRLKRMGFFSTAMTGQPAEVVWPETYDEETVLAIQQLMLLTGLTESHDGAPAFTFEAFPEKGVFKGRLAYGDDEWVSVNKDMTKVWLSLWGKYFGRDEARQAQDGLQQVMVTGWFSPDGALDFDHILSSWDGAVQDVQLLEMDMQPSGVGATWQVRLINRARLAMLLETYLPQRGLSYHLPEGSTE